MKRVSAAELERALGAWQGKSLRGGPDRIQAAVCLPLREGRSGLEAWAIKRPDKLRHHSREIAFPRGKPEPADADLLATPLRDTEEGLGVERLPLPPLGPLTPDPTATRLVTLHPF